MLRNNGHLLYCRYTVQRLGFFPSHKRNSDLTAHWTHEPLKFISGAKNRSTVLNLPILSYTCTLGHYLTAVWVYITSLFSSCFSPSVRQARNLVTNLTTHACLTICFTTGCTWPILLQVFGLETSYLLQLNIKLKKQLVPVCQQPTKLTWMSAWMDATSHITTSWYIYTQMLTVLHLCEMLKCEFHRQAFFFLIHYVALNVYKTLIKQK